MKRQINTEFSIMPSDKMTKVGLRTSLQRIKSE